MKRISKPTYIKTMKNKWFIPDIALMLLIFISSCEKEVNIESEKEAIKAVINSETQAWIDKDPARMKEFYIQDSLQTRVNIQDSIYSVTIGWDKRSVAI